MSVNDPYGSAFPCEAQMGGLGMKLAFLSAGDLKPSFHYY